MGETKAKKESTDPRIPELQKLLIRLREAQATCYEIAEEIDRILGGQASTAVQLKQLYAAFDRVWCARYTPGTTGHYVWTYTKDTPQMKRLLRTLDAATLERRMARYLTNEDPYYTRARHPFLVFAASVNSHAEPQEAPAAAPWRCPDHPPCPVGTAQYVCRTRAALEAGRRGEMPF